MYHKDQKNSVEVVAKVGCFLGFKNIFGAEKVINKVKVDEDERITDEYDNSSSSTIDVVLKDLSLQASGCNVISEPSEGIKMPKIITPKVYSGQDSLEPIEEGSIMEIPRSLSLDPRYIHSGWNSEENLMSTKNLSTKFDNEEICVGRSRIRVKEFIKKIKDVEATLCSKEKTQNTQNFSFNKCKDNETTFERYVKENSGRFLDKKKINDDIHSLGANPFSVLTAHNSEPTHPTREGTKEFSRLFSRKKTAPVVKGDVKNDNFDHYSSSNGIIEKTLDNQNFKKPLKFLLKKNTKDELIVNDGPKKLRRPLWRKNQESTHPTGTQYRGVKKLFMRNPKDESQKQLCSSMNQKPGSFDDDTITYIRYLFGLDVDNSNKQKRENRLRTFFQKRRPQKILKNSQSVENKLQEETKTNKNELSESKGVLKSSDSESFGYDTITYIRYLYPEENLQGKASKLKNLRNILWFKRGVNEPSVSYGINSLNTRKPFFQRKTGEMAPRSKEPKKFKNFFSKRSDKEPLAPVKKEYTNRSFVSYKFIYGNPPQSDGPKGNSNSSDCESSNAHKVVGIRYIYADECNENDTSYNKCLIGRRKNSSPTQNSLNEIIPPKRFSLRKSFQDAAKRSENPTFSALNEMKVYCDRLINFFMFKRGNLVEISELFPKNKNDFGHKSPLDTDYNNHGFIRFLTRTDGIFEILSDLFKSKIQKMDDVINLLTNKSKKIEKIVRISSSINNMEIVLKPTSERRLIINNVFKLLSKRDYIDDIIKIISKPEIYLDKIAKSLSSRCNHDKAIKLLKKRDSIELKFRIESSSNDQLEELFTIPKDDNEREIDSRDDFDEDKGNNDLADDFDESSDDNQHEQNNEDNEQNKTIESPLIEDNELSSELETDDTKAESLIQDNSNIELSSEHGFDDKENFIQQKDNHDVIKTNSFEQCVLGVESSSQLEKRIDETIDDSSSHGDYIYGDGVNNLIHFIEIMKIIPYPNVPEGFNSSQIDYHDLEMVQRSIVSRWVKIPRIYSMLTVHLEDLKKSRHRIYRKKANHEYEFTIHHKLFRPVAYCLLKLLLILMEIESSMTYVGRRLKFIQKWPYQINYRVISNEGSTLENFPRLRNIIEEIHFENRFAIQHLNKVGHLVYGNNQPVPETELEQYVDFRQKKNTFPEGSCIPYRFTRSAFDVLIMTLNLIARIPSSDYETPLVNEKEILICVNEAYEKFRKIPTLISAAESFKDGIDVFGEPESEEWDLKFFMDVQRRSGYDCMSIPFDVQCLEWACYRIDEKNKQEETVSEEASEKMSELTSLTTEETNTVWNLIKSVTEMISVM